MLATITTLRPALINPRPPLPVMAAIDCPDEVEQLLIDECRAGDRERLALAGFDRRGCLRIWCGFDGTAHFVRLPPCVIRTLAASPAVATVVMAHNHPAGDAQPSHADLVLTARLADHFQWLGITLADHLIVGANATVSLRRAGLM